MQEGHKVLLQVRHQAAHKVRKEAARVMGVEMVLGMAMGMGMALEVVMETGVVMAAAAERVLETAAAGIWEMIRGLSVQNRKIKVRL